MRDVGKLLIAVGLFAIAGALFVDVESATRDYSGLLPRSVVNLHALHIQSLVFSGGVGAFVAGAFFFGAGRIVDAIDVLPHNLCDRWARLDVADSQAPHAAAPGGIIEQPGPDPTSQAMGHDDGPVEKVNEWAVIVIVAVAVIALVLIIAMNRTGEESEGPTTNEALELINQADRDLQEARDAANAVLDSVR